MKFSPQRVTAVLAVACALLVGATESRAAFIVNAAGTNSSSFSGSGGGSGDRAGNSSLSTANSASALPTIGAVFTATSRYVSNVAADRGSALSGGTANATMNTNYTVVFTVNPGAVTPAITYDLSINTSILGALTAIDDAAGLSSGGSSSISNISATVNAVANPTLSLATNASIGGTSSTSGTQTVISKNGNISLGTFTGVQVVTLNFTWQTKASSPQNVAGGDEHAVRLGLNDVLGGNGADNYPGVGSRDINQDGHFVSVKATLLTVPEPSTYAMAIMAGLGAVLFGWRRRSA